ncbi:MAG: pyridoxal phosphate-dependent aminotransferase [Acidobacteria bacterium]|nr:pyridoxal phosphate-dependent aminotransferase [Acidobacteriota bacterium]
MLAERILRISEPLIDTLARRARVLTARGANIVNLGQAIPGDAAPRQALAAARRALRRPDVNVYTPDAGIAELRHATAAWIARHDGVRIDPDRQLIITAGANQALMLALQCCTDAGDRVLLPTPYFMNHEMAVRLVDAVPIEVPTTADEGWVITSRRLFKGDTGRAARRKTLKAVIITTPSNPTGAVVPRQEIDRIAKQCASRGMFLILDRTYAGFEFDGTSHVAPSHVARGRLPENVVLVGSFSKVFSMTGWRVGYLAGPPTLIREALKAQDTTIICAPAISQVAVHAALEARRGVTPAYLRDLRRRRDYVQERLASMPGWSAVPAAGGFFTFIRIDGMKDSIAFASRLLERAHVLMLPGRIFGEAGEGHIRLSYGVADVARLEVAFDRLHRIP